MRRRDFLKHVAIGAATLPALPALAKPRAAKHLIVLWLGGGPSQIDTFDPKKHDEYGGSFEAIRTALPGVYFSEHLPKLAQRAKKLAIIRSMSSKEGNHVRARHLLRTSYPPQGRTPHPELSSLVAKTVSKPGPLPPYVRAGGGRGQELFLDVGTRFSPFVVRAGEAPRNLRSWVDRAHFDHRLELLNGIEAANHQRLDVRRPREVRDLAVAMMDGTAARAFSLDREKPKTREAYGDHEFGRGVLTARRLVEAGVSVVEVVLPGWDTHRNNFEQVAQLARTLDGTFAALLDDLSARGLLNDTLVLCAGEFGRTPRINRNGGRDHFPQAYSAVLAGGGLNVGGVLGRTSDDGMAVVDRPVRPGDLLATVYSRFGIDPTEEVETPRGRPLKLVREGEPIRELL